MAKKTIKQSISIRAFARQIGTSDTAIHKAIKERKFTIGFNPKTKTIDPEKAAKDAWVIQQSMVKPKPGVSRVKMIEKLEKQQEAGPASEAGKPTTIDREKAMNMPLMELINSIEVRPDMSFKEITLKRELVGLALDKIKLLKEEGTLVDRHQVNNALYNLGVAMKTSLFDIPKRIARDVMAARNEVEAINIMNEEITRVLNYYGHMADDAKAQADKGRNYF